MKPQFMFSLNIRPHVYKTKKTTTPKFYFKKQTTHHLMMIPLDNIKNFWVKNDKCFAVEF